MGISVEENRLKRKSAENNSILSVTSINDWLLKGAYTDCLKYCGFFSWIAAADTNIWHDLFQMLRNNATVTFTQDIDTSMAVHIDQVQFDWCPPTDDPIMEYSWTYKEQT